VYLNIFMLANFVNNSMGVQSALDKSIRSRNPQLVDSFASRVLFPMGKQYEKSEILENQFYVWVYDGDYCLVYLIENNKGVMKSVKLNSTRFLQSGNLAIVEYLVNYKQQISAVANVETIQELNQQKDILLEMNSTAPFWRSYNYSKISDKVYQIPHWNIIDAITQYRELLKII